MMRMIAKQWKKKKKSDDQPKSNMKWSHINNEYNNGKDNDPEPYEKVIHLTLKENMWQSEYK